MNIFLKINKNIGLKHAEELILELKKTEEIKNETEIVLGENYVEVKPFGLNKVN